MDNLDKVELEKLRMNRETRLVEYKETPILEDKDVVLKEICAFANRAGGTILFGVRDDGSIEGAQIDFDKEIERITNWTKESTSPIVDFYPMISRDSEGDVLGLRIKRRKGIPSAVIAKKHWEVESRKYFVRTNHGVRFVEDATLEWLFEHNEDPVIHKSFRTYVQYKREDISFSGPWEPDSIGLGLTPQFELGLPFQLLNAEQKKAIKLHESDRIRSFVVEVLPFVVLDRLSRIYSQSWNIKILRLGNNLECQIIPCESISQIELNSINRPNNVSFLNEICFDPNSLFHYGLPNKGKICLPEGSSLRINMNKIHADSTTSSISIKKDGAFDLSIRFYPTSWSVGSAPKHPAVAAIGFRDPRELILLQGLIANCCIETTIDATFGVPDMPNDDFSSYLNWAKQITEEINNYWDWDILIGSQPPKILYYIDRNVSEVLNILKKRQSDPK